MTGRDLLYGLGEIREDFIQEAQEQYRALDAGQNRISGKRVVLLAAAAVLMLLTVGCTVVYLLHMRDLQLGERQLTIWETGENNKRHPTGQVVTQQVLTTGGLKGSANYQAAKEWFEFTEQYDPDGQVAEAYYTDGDSPVFPERYDAYNPYSREMVEKLDVISEKYGLKLLGRAELYRSADTLSRAVGVSEMLHPESHAAMEFHNGFTYDDGNFGFLCDLEMPGGASEWGEMVLANIRFIRKGYLNTQTWIIDSGTNYREWNYTTASGNQLLMVHTADCGAWMFCDRPDATVTVSLSTLRKPVGDVDSQTLTDKQLEQIADAIRFDVVPGEPIPGKDTPDWDIRLKSAQTDGLIAHVVLEVTGPEDAALMMPNREVFPGSWRGTAGGDSFGWNGALLGANTWVKDNGDGKSNTCDIEMTLEARSGEKGREIFQPDVPWSIHFSDLISMDWAEGRQAPETLASGDWNVEFTFRDCDLRDLELIREPVTVEAITDWDAQGMPITGDIRIVSFVIRSGSAELRISGEQPYGPTLPGFVRAVMADGTKVTLSDIATSPNRILLMAETTIDLDDLVCVEMGNGPVLEAP